MFVHNFVIVDAIIKSQDGPDAVQKKYMPSFLTKIRHVNGLQNHPPHHEQASWSHGGT